MVEPIEREYVTTHQIYNVLITTYPWVRSGRNATWTRRISAFDGGLIDRRTKPYGEWVAGICNQYKIGYLSGYYQAVPENPLPNFRTSLWAATNLGALRLVHMFSLIGFPARRAQITAEVVSWAADMKKPAYGMIRDSSGAARPILLFWGHEHHLDFNGFTAMINDIRNGLRTNGVTANPFIIGTEHLAGYVRQGAAGAVQALAAVDGLYQHGGGLPWDTCGGCNKTGTVWEAWNSDPGVPDSAQQLAANIQGLSDTLRPHSRVAFAGGMPHFDRELFGSAPQGRVEARNAQQLRQLLTVIRGYAPIVLREEKWENGERHIYNHRWVILTSWNEWEEGTTLEPSLVRGGTPYASPNYDYGLDGVQAIAEVFRPTAVRRLQLAP